MATFASCAKVTVVSKESPGKERGELCLEGLMAKESPGGVVELVRIGRLRSSGRTLSRRGAGGVVRSQRER